MDAREAFTAGAMAILQRFPMTAEAMGSPALTASVLSDCDDYIGKLPT
jgi:hypothetical protein